MDLQDRLRFLAPRPFWVSEKETRTYGDLARAAERAGELVQHHLSRPGEVVALTGGFTVDTVGLFLALWERKAVIASLVGTSEASAVSRASEAGCRLRVESSPGGPVFKHPESDHVEGESPHPLITRLRETGRAGLILFSSGTAGRPKVMLHDLDRLVESYSPGEPKNLRVLAFMGLDHIGGIDIFLRAIASGSALVAPEDRSPEAVCRLIEATKVDVLPATPSFLNLLLLSEAWRGRDLSSVKIIAFGAERMPTAVLERLREVFPGARWQQKFGTSETNAVRTVNKPSDPLWIKIDDPVVEWKIVEEELWLKTPSRILGYLNAESDRLTEDGWFRTGDLVERDGEGFFRIVARREAMINVGGEKVVPGEVEAVLRDHPAVDDCRVFSQANPILGQVVGAEVVLSPGQEARETVKNLRRHCRTRLEPHKVPVKIQVVESIAMGERFKRSIS